MQVNDHLSTSVPLNTSLFTQGKATINPLQPVKSTGNPLQIQATKPVQLNTGANISTSKTASGVIQCEKDDKKSSFTENIIKAVASGVSTMATGASLLPRIAKNPRLAMLSGLVGASGGLVGALLGDKRNQTFGSSGSLQKALGSVLGAHPNTKPIGQAITHGGEVSSVLGAGNIFSVMKSMAGSASSLATLGFSMAPQTRAIVNTIQGLKIAGAISGGLDTRTKINDVNKDLAEQRK